MVDIIVHSGVSVISHLLDAEMFSQQTPIDLSSVRLRSLRGEAIEQKEMLQVRDKWMGKVNSCTLLVVEREVQALMGRDWLKMFNWPGLNHVESAMEIGNDLYLLISSYKELFKEQVCCYNHGKIGLLINPN